MQMLGNFGAKLNFIILYFLISSLSKNRFSTTEEANIYRRCKQIQHFSKNWNIARNIICFIHVIIGQTKLFSPAYLLILFKVQLSSEYVLKQKYKLKYA